MILLLRRPCGVVWVVLVVATGLMWLVGGHGESGPVANVPGSVVIALVAFFKVRLIGRYFMDLKTSPVVLQSIFEAYVVIACALVIWAYLRGA